MRILNFEGFDGGKYRAETYLSILMLMLSALTLIRAKNLWKPSTYLLIKTHLPPWRWRIKMLHTESQQLQTQAYPSMQQNVKKQKVPQSTFAFMSIPPCDLKKKYSSQ